MLGATLRLPARSFPGKMKYSTVAVVAVLAATVSAQGPPTCALSCITSPPSGSTSCSSTDFACLCKDTEFQAIATECICKSCTTKEDQDAAGAFAATTCKSFGVDLDTPADCPASGGAASSAPASAPASSAPASSAPAATASAPASAPASSAPAATSAAAPYPSGNATATGSTPGKPSGTGAATATPSTPPPAGNNGNSLAVSGALTLFGVVAAVMAL
jgi:pyruvate/2-oxoglutarate dehydrogenase complex dihydrolipoamide acyltransferase (E2) component